MEKSQAKTIESKNSYYQQIDLKAKARVLKASK